MVDVMTNIPGDRQGKCDHCQKRWIWSANVRLRDAHCPTCGRQLRQTTYLLQRYPTVRATSDELLGSRGREE